MSKEARMEAEGRRDARILRTADDVRKAAERSASAMLARSNYEQGMAWGAFKSQDAEWCKLHTAEELARETVKAAEEALVKAAYGL